MSAWNKGLTKETSESVRRVSESKAQWWKEQDRTETKRRISENHARPGLGKKGILNPRWKGGRLVNKRDGYISLYTPSHPHANSKGYVLEHRLMMEHVIGRLLLPDEDVNHINGIKDDNRAENLMLVRHNAHFSLHQCPRCRFEWAIR